MRRLIAVCIMVLCAGVITAAEPSREMKVKVFCPHQELSTVAKEVLEFYEVKDDYFVGAVTAETYKKLVNRGFRVEVLVEDMQEWARLQCPGEDFGRYHSYQEIMDTFALIATTYPNICKLETIAVSPTGKFLIAMKITQNPMVENHRPRLEWDGTIHGNENIGTEICWYITRRLTEGYGSDPLITHLVNTREIWVVPCMNPEGLINRTRTNSNGIDLNRDFGYAWNQESGANVPWSQPEIQGFRNFLQRQPFVITMTYHSGTRSVMWPWSYSQIATRDSVAHQQLCQLYSSITGYPAFQISRGLYECTGTSSDFTYGAEGALGLAAEVSNSQPPPQGEIDTICRANWTASVQLMIRGAWGIRGQITDSVTGLPVKRAIVVPVPTNWMVYTDTTGWFFKYVLPGTYTLKVMADGYQTKTVSGIVVPNDTFVVVNVALNPDSTTPITGYKVTTWICKSSTGAGSTMGLAALGRRDNSTLSLTTRGMAVIELSEEIINGPGTDFTVYSTTNKPCSVFVSSEWNGPWSFCAYGSGNIACDLASAGINIAKFVRLNDAGQNYDLDAIEGVVVNAPALVFQNKTVIDSPPGGNGDGKLDAGESAALTVALRNAGRLAATNVTGTLRTSSPFVSVVDSIGFFGEILPDSVRTNSADRFEVVAAPETPREHQAEMRLYLSGNGYSDSISFIVTVGELRVVDPIPDNANPVIYWAYDEIDTLYAEHPEFNWVEIRNLGTRLTLSDDQIVQINLPPSFGPFVFYGQPYTQISVCSNGWLAPGYTTSTSYQNTSLPNSSMPPLLAANWDDLYPPSGNGVWYYHDSVNHRFIVEWDSVRYWSPNTIWEKFQIILYDTTLAGGDGNCKFAFQYLTANYPGNSATVGTQNQAGARFIQVLYNGTYHRAASPWVPGHAIKFSTDYQTGIAENRVSGLSPVHLALRVAENPAQSRVVLHYSLPFADQVSLEVFDRSGRLVRRFEFGEQRSGNYRVQWDGRDNQGRTVPAGVYWVRLSTSRQLKTVKAVLVR
ncbi:hypothetical protein HPY86_01960 [candidate division WOR-3 bacterium]|nr:hypothetical protein [candidate division WOR-3 bacterium]